MTFAKPLILFSVFSFLTAVSLAEEVRAPKSDFGQVMATCERGVAGQASASFQLVLNEKRGTSGPALLVSSLQPYYSTPFLNRVSYAVTADHTIVVDHADFQLRIDAQGQGIYLRKGQVPTPPTLPGEDLTPASSVSSAPQADYELYKPISLRCSSPFTPQDPPPTGFSTGN